MHNLLIRGTFAAALVLAPATAAAATGDIELHLTLASPEVQSDQAVDLTVELVNNSSDLLGNVAIGIDFLDAAGTSALGSFDVAEPVLVGIGAVDGTPIFSSLAPGATASASFAITPLAASILGSAATAYSVVATLDGVVEGVLKQGTFPAQELRVLPAAKLEFELYWPSAVHGDWSATTAIFEAPEPFSIAAVIRNTGAGVATGLSLASPGPSFAPDAQGAAVFAEVQDLEVDGVATAGGFGLPVGTLADLAPGDERRILWTATSSFEGSLTAFPASLLTDGALVTPASVVEESLVHAALAFESPAGPLDDGRVDWLIDEPGIPAPLDPVTGMPFTEFPSVVRSSEGSDLSLIPDISATLGAPPSSVNLMSTATITVGGPSWHYVRFDDPGGFLFDLAGVTRTQKALHLAGLDVGGPGEVSRVWTTARSVDLNADGLPDIVRREVHIVDFIPAAGTWEYGLSYVESGAAALSVNVELISATAGGTQLLTLDAGAGHAGEIYILLGSLSGTSPGTPVDATVLPLNVDGYFLELLTNPTLQALFGSIGALDGQGRGTALITVPPGFAVGTGLAAHHAFLTLPASGPITFASNAVVLFLLP